MKNEPVAWLWIHKGVVMNALLRNPDCNERNKEYWSKKGWHSEPLYTHPAKTYEDAIEECAQRAEAYAYMSPNFTALAEEFRAILKKASEK